MGTNRVRRARRKAPSEAWQLEYLLHGLPKTDDMAVRRRALMYLEEFRGCFANNGAPAAWMAVRARALPKWIKERPGTRPFIWWELETPEWLPYDVREGMSDEAQAAYLASHGLLEPAEMVALGIEGGSYAHNQA